MSTNDPVGPTSRVLRCATLVIDGWPHVVPLWFVELDGDLWVSTLDGSITVRALVRDPRATLVLDAGEHLLELHGRMIRTSGVVDRDRVTVTRVNEAMLARYADLVPPGFADAMHSQPRVALRFHPAAAPVTWDNRPDRGDRP